MNNMRCRNAAVIYAVVATLLAACGGSQPPIGVPRTAQQVNGVSAHSINNRGYKLLYSFKGGSDGQLPFAGLTFVKGVLYGTTTYGGYLGSPCNDSNGCGTVFRFSTTGSKTVIYSFKGPPDAGWPQFALLNLNGTLYSTTQGGGAGCVSGDGCGTVFGVTTSGSEHVVYSFKGGSDGATPFASLIAVNGKLYGTTYGGGSTRCAGGCGTVFEVNTAGRERILHRFKGYPHDGENPIGPLVAVNGELYGTTWGGGSGCNFGCGTIFAISASGTERVLHNFNGAPDGGYPEGGLVDVGGKLYGTTIAGGTSGACPKAGGCGTFFRLGLFSTDESYSVIYSFVGGRNSAEPNGGLLPLNGLFYGTAAGGDRCGYYYRCGTVFDVSKSGKERLLHRFHSQGQEPKSPGWPLVARNGLIYGTTLYGGASNLGAVYRIEP
jgi:uncharacterized repeat protein (TIGR03803 family)